MSTMPKSRDAFRTISEVADWLDTPAHVLRFWESKFTQVRPVKRAGGRRYYRPADMELLGGIKKLLHEDGMTIKGVQKLLREQGVRYVSSLSPQTVDGSATGTLIDDAPYAEVESAETVVPFARSGMAPTADEVAPDSPTNDGNGNSALPQTTQHDMTDTVAAESTDMPQQGDDSTQLSFDDWATDAPYADTDRAAEPIGSAPTDREGQDTPSQPDTPDPGMGASGDPVQDELAALLAENRDSDGGDSAFDMPPPPADAHALPAGTSDKFDTPMEDDAAPDADMTGDTVGEPALAEDDLSDMANDAHVMADTDLATEDAVDAAAPVAEDLADAAQEVDADTMVASTIPDDPEPAAAPAAPVTARRPDPAVPLTSRLDPSTLDVDAGLLGHLARIDRLSPAMAQDLEPHLAALKQQADRLSRPLGERTDR